MLAAFRYLILTSFLAIICAKSFASTEPYENFIKGALKKGDSVMVKDEKFKNPSFNWSQITNIKVSNNISLRILSEQEISKSFSCQMKLSVAYFSTPEQQIATIDTITLNVNYNKTTGASYHYLDNHEFANAFEVKVKILEVTSPEYGLNIPPVLQLNSNIIIERIYAFNHSQFIGINGEMAAAPKSGGIAQRIYNGSINTSNNHLDLSWSLISGAMEYDIEWVSVDAGSEWETLADNALANAPNLESQLAALFRNNATRITTPSQTYSLSLLYNTKYILVRMRGVAYTSGGLRDEGDWFYKKEFNNEYSIWPILVWHEQNLNWQYSATYAEQGKKKEVVNYMDGTLRGRQTVTINNSDNFAVVQENIYDKYGRAAASILPAPIKEQTSLPESLHYFPNFNRNSNNTPFTAANLVVDPLNCSPTPEALNNNSGAANYYSNANSLLSNTSYINSHPFMKYLPDAAGYPLSVTQYTADNTGRIKVQGGVGLTFQPKDGVSRTTKYYYGKPDQWELDTLFGNDVGYAEHYLKNTVIDPNGQASISYINASGKTIATALAGASPDNLSPLLSSLTVPHDILVPILKPNQFTYNSSEKKLTATSTYIVTTPSTVTLSYDIETLMSRYPGGAWQPCSNCYYDVKITVRNDCKKDPIWQDDGSLKFGTDIANCNFVKIPANNITIPFTDIGEYYISFEFVLSNKVIEKFTDNFITEGQGNGNLKSKKDFLNYYLTGSNFADCFTDCKTALSRLGTITEFRTMFNAQLIKYGEDPLNYNQKITDIYAATLTKVQAFIEGCNITPVSPCDSYKRVMLSDVSPGGQYAMVDLDGNLLEPSVNVIELYYHNGAFNERSPSDPLYIATSVTREDGKVISPYDLGFSKADLVKYWQDEWAEQFLQYHPEHCKLLFCQANTASAFWDQRLRETTDTQDVLAAASVSWTPDNATWLLAEDPFFKEGSVGFTYKPSMLNDLNNYSTLVLAATGYTAKNISQVSLYQLYCADANATTNQNLPANWDNCSPKTACRIANREWQSYRDLYLDLKLKYFQMARKANDCAAACEIGEPVALLPNTNCNDLITLGSSGMQVAANKFQESNYTTNIQTTYTFISGSKLTAPNLTGICSTATPVWYDCVKVTYPGAATPVSFYNVWKITCEEAVTTCSNVLLVYTSNPSPNVYVSSGTGYSYVYTFYPGLTSSTPPDAYCNGNSVTPYFYECYTVYYAGIRKDYHNVWVSVCYTTYNTDPCDEELPQEMRVAIVANKATVAKNGSVSAKSTQTSETNVVPPCEVYELMKAGLSENEELTSAYYNQSIYSILPQVGTSKAKKALPTKRGYTSYEFKERFVVESRPGLFKIHQNVWVAALIPDTASIKAKHEKNIAKVLSKVSGAKGMAAKSGGAQTMGFVNGTCVSFYDGYLFSYQTVCYNNPNQWTSNTTQTNETAIVLHDTNGNPVNATVPVTVNVKYLRYVGGDPGGGTNEVIYAITIPIGQSSAYITYEVSNWYSAGFSECVSDHTEFVCVESITGSDFCDFVPTCGGGTTVSCPPALATKEMRFEPTIPTNPISVDPAALDAKIQADLQANIAEVVNENINLWMSDLADGLVGKSASDIAILKAKLQELAIAAGDLQHPMGASSLPPSNTTGISVKGIPSFNFGDVIKNTFSITTFTNTLNPYLITSIYPYGPLMQSTENIVSSVSPAIRDLLYSLRPASSTDAQFYAYLQSTYGAAMTLSYADFQILLEGCYQCQFLLREDIMLPVFLTPGGGGCVNRANFDAAITTLNNEFGITVNSAMSNYETIYTTFLNHKFGFAFGFDRLREFDTNKSLPQLCHEPPFGTIVQDRYDCVYPAINVAYGNAMRDYYIYLQEERTKFRNAYISTCAAAKANANLKVSQQIYHYTLYYYDMAGNLVRTVPPEGVAFLSSNEMKQVQKARDFNSTNCNFNGQSASTDENAGLLSLSSVLTNAGNNAIELWMYSNNSQGRQFISATPDMKYMFQACLNGTLINVDIFTLSQTASGNVSFVLSNHVTADVATISPLTPWTHVVVQGTNLASGALQIWVNGLQYTPVANSPSAGCSWTVNGTPVINMPHNLGTLKHMRLYSGRLMSGYEIASNAASGCFNAYDINALSWFKFNQPTVPGGSTAIAFDSANETQYSGVYPAHGLTTSYAYNSTNQVMQQKTPDAGISRFWYDNVGRLTASQNARQEPLRQFSYTKFDLFGRITEVGQKGLSSSELTALGAPFTEPSYLDNSQRTTFLGMGSNSELTQTIYDTQPAATGGVPSGFTLNNLRKRVAASIYRETPSSVNINASYYDYDYTGNVKTLRQQVDGLGLKRLDYEFDLHSGKVNFLAYQHGANDQFYYQYEYDAENRLIQAATGTTANVISYGFGSRLTEPNKRVDATYAYYPHGPLARVELGEDAYRVQGTDYAYTLQGWLKGVNGNGLDPAKDIGNDGQGASNVAKDALSYSLGYYNGDYTAIGGGPAFGMAYQQQAGDITGQSLYNGNIGNSTYGIKQVASNATTGYTYAYDQLNRLKTSQLHNSISGTWNRGSITAGNYGESFSYDGNGNILSLLRNKQTGVMDQLTYNYNRDANGKLVNNRLNGVNDAAGVNNGSDVGTTAYTYDGIGNLIKDNAENISNIDWNVYGKIKKIDKNNAAYLNYTYDATGNRASKTVANVKTDWYVRDAQGNTLAEYSTKVGIEAVGTYWREQHLYGSSRLGIWKPNVNVSTPPDANVWNTAARKNYELNNHLGNVMAVITEDRDLNGGDIKPTLVSSQDYYSFGGQMTGRKGGLAYRYGFNGKENDDEVKGEGNQQDYGMRIYDPRIAKFLSVDPITADYPELTPYQFGSNSPISNIDLDGLEKLYYNLTLNKEGKPKLELMTIEYFVKDPFIGNYVAQPLSNTVTFNGEVYFFQSSRSGYYETENTMDDLGKWLYISNTTSDAPAFNEIFYSKKEFWNEVMDQSLNEWVDGLIMSKISSKATSGVIYEVPGEFTSSGKPYIGRHNSPDPANRSSADGRPRGKANAIGSYDKSDPKEGAYKEQMNMNVRGGKSKLDNKRNEVNPLRMEALTKKYGGRRNIILPATKQQKQKEKGKEKKWGDVSIDIINHGPQ